MISNELLQLSKQIKLRNEIEKNVSEITKRPFIIGHIGEYIASDIFDIQLNESATEKSYDGLFLSGNFKDKTVNIKYYSRKGSVLDLCRKEHPDYYLVLMGNSLKKEICPWNIESVFLFESTKLIEKIDGKVKIGTATSIKKEYWDEARIYSSLTNDDLVIDESIKEKLELFKP